MLDLSPHTYRMGPCENNELKDEDLMVTGEETPELQKKKNERIAKNRQDIEPWLTAVFQSEHLSLLLGNGFTTAVALASDVRSADMSGDDWKEIAPKGKVKEYAKKSAKACRRGAPNIEDEIRAAMQLHAGLRVMDEDKAGGWKTKIDEVLKRFMDSILDTERSILNADEAKRQEAENLLMSFLLSFASRAATRERLNLFTTNYDRLVEYGCDLAGLHVLDRFVGALSPVFRASRLGLDIHYNPPGIRGEPRYLEGVIRLSKIHGSLDWRWEGGTESQPGKLRRNGLPFGAQKEHPDNPEKPSDTVMIYPNAAKDVETLDYPYAELFRDFAAGVCRPNSSLVTYGYGFGDDHVNRVIKDMLTIPSTHLVIIAWDKTKPDDADNEANASRQRIINFCESVGKDSQISLLLGSHFGDLSTLVRHYLPKPAIDLLTNRMAENVRKRDMGQSHTPGKEATDEQSD